ncbi:MAG TPA: DUF4331 family protein [Blastocatellia bacterium]|nr:DUF4331 family protein [Blastocatellia bacterium]HMX25618.1 DUF4331 family protein [Blastocatellia bacterium]HMY74327.1 DUF4331 family protein [Blastocatellia bacterium]HMZ22348.1 DUF4331 family protein [Blastocatellia bacterium]HNG34548.1 DUF4331 family protein [Blastocatellia bacterium]
MLHLSSQNKKFAALALALNLLLVLVTIPTVRVGAADHGDSPSVAGDRSADLADLYMFLDPNDNTKLIVLSTVHGFIVPGEAVNFGLFDHTIRYRIDIEANGDTTFDGYIDVNFSEKVNSGATPQTVTISSSFFPTFTAPTTPPNLSPTAPTPTVTTDPGTGIAFFAGMTDDPFFFDIPAFSRFVASVGAGSPNPAVFNRGRDTFAGYNVLVNAFSIPVQLLRSRLNIANNSIGMSVRSQRRATSISRAPSRFAGANYIDIEREAIPAVNAALIPYARKNEYNLATAQDDANGRFANSIIATLTTLGTNQANIGILAGVAVNKGDILRLDLTKANTGPGGGTNPEAAFPNGRRPADDVIDTILFFIANQTKFGDNVNANDVPFRDTFPFLAPSQQPRDSGDDNTKN